MASTTTPRPPTGLESGGRQLWRDVTRDHPGLNRVQLVQLHEACRMKDRCDKLDQLLRGDVDAWATIVPSDVEGEFKLQIAGALGRANETANSMKQLLAAMRLPDEATGKRPQQRGPRGAQKPSQPGGAQPTGKVSSIERARQRAEAAQTGS